MRSRDVALRAQDIQASFSLLQGVPANLEVEMEASMLTGMASRLATHIRGADVFEGDDDVKRLKVTSASLDIRGSALRDVLRVLEEAEMVRAKYDANGQIVKLEEFIPTYGDLYERIGAVHQSRPATEVETALIETFHDVVGGPKKLVGNLPFERLGQRMMVQLENAADQAGIIRSAQGKDGSQIYYSPQYWDENAEKVAQVVDRYGDGRVRDLVQAVQGHQGMALPPSTDESDYAVMFRDLAQMGILPSPLVSGWKGSRAFGFTPFKGASDDPAVEAKKMEKTRAILSCVRYGENFGTITSVNDPVRLLEALRDRGRIGPHSEAYDQYKTLLDQQIARISRSVQFPSRFFVHFISNEENLDAINAAISLLRTGVPIEVTVANANLQRYARMEGDYVEPVRARSTKEYEYTPSARAAFRNDMIDLALR